MKIDYFMIVWRNDYDKTKCMYSNLSKARISKRCYWEPKNVSNGYLGHEVVARDTYEFSDDVGIILALKPEYQLEVFSFFQEKNRVENLFAWPEKFAAYYFLFLDSLENNEVTGKIWFLGGRAMKVVLLAGGFGTSRT